MINKLKQLLARPYSWLLLFFVLYLGVFFLLEKITLNYHLVHVALDEVIPYNSLFFVPYFSWYIVFFGLPVLFLAKDTGDYLRLCFLQFVPVLLCCAVYFIWPTCQDLRPENPDGPFGWAAAILYSADPPVNVCPSIHVCSSLSAAIGLCLSKRYRLRTKVLFCLWMLLIILSTVFMRQHSVIDVLWGVIIVIPFAVFAETPVGKKWLHTA